MTAAKLLEIPEGDQTLIENSLLAYIDELVNTVAQLKEENQQLKDEIAHLKGQKPKPKIPPSKLEGPKSKGKGKKSLEENIHAKRKQASCKFTANSELSLNRFQNEPFLRDIRNTLCKT